jgi:RHS repeat-associated protein
MRTSSRSRTRWFARLRVVLAACCALVVASLLATNASAQGRGTIGATPKNSFETPAVREAIAHEILPEPGPLKLTQGGSGGDAEPGAPAGGELQPDLSTAYSNTWQIPREHLVSRIYAAPVNYKGSDGAWHAISSTLVPAALGGYQNEANSFSLHVPMSLSSGMSLTDGADSLSFSLQDGKEALPIVSGTTATYKEALTSTDFQYQSSSTGVKETALLKDASAPQALRFTLSASPGLTAREDAEGAIELLDQQGAMQFRIPAPEALRLGADPASGRALTSTLSASGEGWTLSVDTSAPWLREELSSGPVAVDPGIEVGGSQNCTIESDALKTSACTGETFQAGYQSEAPAHEHHGLLQFSLSSLPSDVNVLNARLGLYLQSKSTSNAKAVGVYRVEKPWTTGATWETYDGTHAWSTAGGDYANPSENSDASINPSVGTATGWQYWYPTKMVQEWANGPNSPAYKEEAKETLSGAVNDGLIVKDETDNVVNNVLTFSSIHASSHQPFLEVAYEQRGIGREPQFTILSTQVTDKISAGVNVGSGDMLLENQDLQIHGRGIDFSSSRVYNSLDPDIHDYGRWNDSNFRELGEFADGSVDFADASEAHYAFIKKADGTYITPPGIKATYCTAGHAPCPTTLPSGVGSRLIYNESQSYIDFTTFGWSYYQSDRHERKNLLTAGFTEGIDGITSWTDTEGRKIKYTLNPASFYTELKDVTGERSLKYEYEGTGTGAKLIGYTDAAGNTTKYHYEFGDINKVTTPKGNVLKLVYDGLHRIHEVVRTTNAEHTTGPATKYDYYTVGKAPEGCEAKQKATVVVDPIGAAEEQAKTKAKREPEKEESEGKVKAAESHQTLYCINVLDEVEKVLNYKKAKTQGAFDPFGNQISSTAAARETGGSQGITSLVYGTGGQNLGCEVGGMTEAKTTCPGKQESHGYSTEAKYTEPEGGFKYQPTQEFSSRRKETTLCYWGAPTECGSGSTGAAGELKQQTLPLTGGPSLKYEYNSDGTIKSSTDADGHATTYEYDASGNLKTITPPSGSGLGKTTITVDALSRPEKITQCLVESGGSCTSSQTATLTYDKLDRVVEAVDTGPGATKTFKYTYDADGNVEKRVDPTGTTKFALDPLNRLTEETLPGSLSNAYSYDEASNLLSFTDAGGGTHYFYNGLNQLEAMYEPGGNCGEAPAKCTHAKYDGAGSLEQLTYPSGATVNYGVDATTGRPTSITVKNPSGSTTLLSDTYSYEEGTSKDTPLIYKDVYSQPGSATNTTEYFYDALDRLEEAKTTGTAPSRYYYKLDPAGNRTAQEVNTTGSEGGEKTYFDYNSSNGLECRMKVEAVCSKSSSSEISGYTHDGAGNETAITGYADPASTAFSYNNLSQLKSLTPPSSSEQAATFLGSGQGSLTGLGSLSMQNSALGLTKQVNESGTSYYARTPSGAVIDERLPGSTSYNPVFNAQGNLVALLNTSGELVQTVRYGPYGENAKAEGITSSATTDPFLFQGGYHVAGGNAGSGNIANNLYHFGARFYDPTVGAWTQGDPLGGGYTFAGDDPVNESDPAGTCAFDKNLDPPVFSRGNITFIQICGTHGKRAGKTVGYLRVHSTSPAARARNCFEVSGFLAGDPRAMCRNPEGESYEEIPLPSVGDLPIRPPGAPGWDFIPTFQPTAEPVPVV